MSNTSVFDTQEIYEDMRTDADLEKEGVMNLETNNIPKGMVTLESLFEMLFKSLDLEPTSPSEEPGETFNLGSFVTIGAIHHAFILVLYCLQY